MFKQPFGMLALALTVVLTAWAGQAAAVPTPIAFRVLCADPVLAAKFSKDIGEVLSSRSGYSIDPKGAEQELIVYVNQDVNSRVNTKGVSVAIVHVSRLFQFYLGYKLLIEKPTADSDVQGALRKLLEEESLLHISVAHLDEPSDDQIEIVSRSIAATFLDKTPADAGRNAAAAHPPSGGPPQR